MKQYHFRVVVSDTHENLDDLEDWLFNAGCDDALLCLSSGVAYLDFDREAQCLDSAVQSALESMSKVGLSGFYIHSCFYEEK